MSTLSSEIVGPTGASSPRLIVLQVKINNDGSKDVRVLETRINVELMLHLHGDWTQSDIQATHIVRTILITKNGKYIPWHTSDHKHCSIIIDNDNNLLILHPDTLVSGTTVSDSFRCIRKSVLTSRTPPSFIGEAAMFGSMIHDLFQNILVLDSNTRDYSTSEELSQTGGVDIMSFFETVEDVVSSHAKDLFASNIPSSHARKVLHKIVPQVLQWYKSFMGSGNFHQTEGVLVPIGGKSLCNVIVTKVHDIEELVWSPVLGLKGKIDASVHIHVNGEDCGIAVLELKTGKAIGYTSVSHSAQVSLYKLLLSDRKGAPVTHGLLTYIRYQKALQSVREDEEKQMQQMKLINGNGTSHDGHIHDGINCERVELKSTVGLIEDGMSHRLVATVRSELVALILQRNRIAAYLRSDCDIEDLPPVLIGQKDVCERCFATDTCLIQHKMLEGGTEETVHDGPGKDLFREKAGHLTKNHADYYSFWRKVLADEEERSIRDVNLLWSMSATRKEAMGKCASNLLLVVDQERDDEEDEGDANSEIEEQNISPHALLPVCARTVATFRRFSKKSEGHHLYDGNDVNSLLGCGLTVGDYVVVSAERLLRRRPVKLDLNVVESKSQGQDEQHVLEGSETWQSALTNGFIQKVSKDSIQVSVERSLAAWIVHQGVEVIDVAWRIDGEETAVSHNIAKRTLDTLFSNEAVKSGVTRRRQLIVDGVAPVFSTTTLPSKLQPVKQSNSEHIMSDVNLNEEQKRAVGMSFRARDYMLILGMPGTGKTATLAAIVVAHARAGKSILLCSHTNTAVDNLLGRLLSLGFDDFIRLGRNINVIDKKIHPYHVSVLVDCASETTGANWNTVEQAVSEKKVVATTCLGIGHWVLQKRQQFDLVVVDEASQMMQPICLGPLLYTGDVGAFVLVGDHYQLPPLQRAGVGVGRRITKLAREQECEQEEKKTEDNIGEKSVVKGKEADVGFKCEESLFRRLCVRHPESMVLLSKQYRMADEIMELCNEMVYGGSLKSGNDKVSNQQLETNWQKHNGHGDDHFSSGYGNDVTNMSNERWLDYVRNPDRRVVFIDTKEEGEKAQNNVSTEDGKARRNGDVESTIEVEIIQRCVRQLVQDGLKSKNISILTPFRAQVNLLKATLKKESETKECDISTVDQYQGKDNKCVILSFVKSGDGSVGHLLKDWRRMNVAITRAKCKLIFVGSANSISKGTHFIRHLIKYLRSKNAVVCYVVQQKTF